MCEDVAQFTELHSLLVLIYHNLLTLFYIDSLILIVFGQKKEGYNTEEYNISKIGYTHTIVHKVE